MAAMFELLPTPRGRWVWGTTRHMRSERDLGMRMPLGLDAVDYFNLVIFVAMMGYGIVFLLTALAFARHDPGAITWIPVGFMIAAGLPAGLLRFLLTTGWMETSPDQPGRRS